MINKDEKKSEAAMKTNATDQKPKSDDRKNPSNFSTKIFQKIDLTSGFYTVFRADSDSGIRFPIRRQNQDRKKREKSRNIVKNRTLTLTLASIIPATVALPRVVPR